MFQEEEKEISTFKEVLEEAENKLKEIKKQVKWDSPAGRSLKNLKTDSFSDLKNLEDRKVYRVLSNKKIIQVHAKILTGKYQKSLILVSDITDFYKYKEEKKLN